MPKLHHQIWCIHQDLPKNCSRCIITHLPNVFLIFKDVRDDGVVTNLHFLLFLFSRQLIKYIAWKGSYIRSSTAKYPEPNRLVKLVQMPVQLGVGSASNGLMTEGRRIVDMRHEDGLAIEGQRIIDMRYENAHRILAHPLPLCLELLGSCTPSCSPADSVISACC